MNLLKMITVLIISSLLFSACKTEENTADEQTETSVPVSETLISSDANLININAETSLPPAPFTDYTFEFKGSRENYMIIISRGEFEDEIVVEVENNRYESREFIITAPAGYIPEIPFAANRAESVVKVITNDIDDAYIPDIMQFTFSPADIAEDQPQEPISKLYTVDGSGELREISIIYDRDSDGDGENEEIISEYLDRTQLYHSEPDKFIYEISVDSSNIYDNEGNIKPIGERVKIKTFTFDSSVPCLRAGLEELTEEKPLYFGYAYWAAANSIAQYFCMTSFNVSDWDNYIEVPISDDSAYTEYFFRIDDSRFETTEDMIGLLKTVFTEAAANRIFSEAPQKYQDYDGSIYGIVDAHNNDYSLGTLTFSGMDVSEDRMIFRSRQEKYDDLGNFTGYTDGGNFIIQKNAEGVWQVSQYRYPYSIN